MNERERLKHKLKLLKSDLRDCRDPKVLARWPNLGRPDVIANVTKQIADIENRLSNGHTGD